ncbi:MAG: DUF58 domain-containing protein [Flavobacteriales bacterium]
MALGVVIFLYALSFALMPLEALANVALAALAALTIADTLLLSGIKNKLHATRNTGKIFSLGDHNPVEMTVENSARFTLRAELYDELPVQFQERNFFRKVVLGAGSFENISYTLRPVIRGEYHFNMLNAIATTVLGLCARRVLLATPQMVPVLPSIIQMKKYELLAFARISNYEGIKHIRRLGHSYEFEKIRNYVQGDDIRTINWKATGRRNTLMVNQYEDERSQQVYMVLDKSRSMHMPFNGLSLLDYSVNTSLVLANIALKKYDKTGLITFANRIGSTLPADRSELQLKKILYQLYREKPQPFEANYELMYRAVKNVIHGRSLLFLYLNFESAYAMERALPVIQKINAMHLLVVMIFENTELEKYSDNKPDYLSDIYAQTIAKKLLNDKKQIVARFRKYGIQTILSKPEDLSINTVNKYLELKARGLI